LKKTPLRSSILLLLIILTAGCGLKGNPVSSSTMTGGKPVIRKMEAVSAADAVVLKWDFRNNDGSIQYIYIERSENGTPGNECSDCPRRFERTGQITIEGISPADKETTFSFADKKAVKGKIYTYRLQLCANNGNCSDSAPVEINYQ
jgi:hypothetical protein